MILYIITQVTLASIVGKIGTSIRLNADATGLVPATTQKQVKKTPSSADRKRAEVQSIVNLIKASDGRSLFIFQREKDKTVIPPSTAVVKRIQGHSFFAYPHP